MLFRSDRYRQIVRRHIWDRLSPYSRCRSLRIEYGTSYRSHVAKLRHFGKLLSQAIAANDETEIVDVLNRLRPLIMPRSFSTLISKLHDKDLIEDYRQCEDCGTLHHVDDSLIYDDGNICSDCAENYCTCERRRCGETCRTEDTRNVEGEIWCEHCADNYAYFWESDQEYHTEPEPEYEDEDEDEDEPSIAPYGSTRCCRLTGPTIDRKSTRLNSSHTDISRMPSSA